MHISSRLLAAVVLLLSTASLGADQPGQATPAPAPPDTIVALLVEVRGLRAAMEQMAAAGPRVQLALGRLQLQEQRIDTLVRRLDEVRRALAPARLKLQESSERLQHFENASRDAPIEEQRRDAEAALPRMKREAALAGAEVQRLQSDEGMLLQDINSEQNLWTDFNQRLEELERSLPRR